MKTINKLQKGHRQTQLIVFGILFTIVIITVVYLQARGVIHIPKY